MLRRLLLPTLLALAALPAASAAAAESFLGVLADGRAVRFVDAAPTALTTPKRITGLAAGDRIVALGGELALGRTGRIYRFDARTLRATPTAASVSLRGKSFSIVAAGAGARVLSDAPGFDVTADLQTGATTAGAGLRLTDGTVVAPAVTALPDGRLTGFEPRRGRLVTETAAGSGVVTESPIRQTLGRLNFTQPNAFAVAGSGRGFILSGLPDVVRRPQSRLIAIDLATGAATGEAGPYFFRSLVALRWVGTVPADTTPPRASILSFPRTVSLRDLRKDGEIVLRVRCSEACIVNAGTAVGGRTNITTSGSRDTPGIVRVSLFRLSIKEARLMRARIGRTAIFRAFVQDWSHNQRVITRTFRLTR